MFAPFHQAAADELVRVTRRGGRIGLVSWTPEGFIGQMFATMRPYAPPPPPGVAAAAAVGVAETTCATLLGDRVDDVEATRGAPRGRPVRRRRGLPRLLQGRYGPTIAVYRSLADQPDRVAALDAALADLGDRHLADGVMAWEYLLLTARRR